MSQEFKPMNCAYCIYAPLNITAGTILNDTI